MKWLDVDSIRFSEHMAIFLITRHDSVDFQEIVGWLSEFREATEPELLCEALKAIVVRVRPELAECQAWSLAFEQEYQAWAVGVSHPSLPLVSPGSMIKRIYLFEHEVAA